VGGELVARVGEDDPAQSRVTPAALATVVALVAAQRLSVTAAREVLDALVAQGGDPESIRLIREALGLADAAD
jgi:aspartyl-tRNA(Asn)/glutamyl-tRNA(Gln) amidotransferase subunit B